MSPTLGGFETFMGQDGKVQNPTMLFRLMGVDVERFRAHYGQDTIMGEEVSQMIRNLHNSREYDLPRSKIFLFLDAASERTAVQLHAHHRPRRPRAQSDIGRGYHRGRDPGPQTGARIRQFLQGSPGRLRGILCQRHRRAGRRSPDPADQGRHHPAQRRRRRRHQEQERDRALGLADRAAFRRKAAAQMAAR